MILNLDHSLPLLDILGILKKMADKIMTTIRITKATVKGCIVCYYMISVSKPIPDGSLEVKVAVPRGGLCFMVSAKMALAWSRIG
jgi:hypothetical protein